MPKPQVQFVCTSCNATSARWVGRCPSCDSYNTIEEKPLSSAPGKSSIMGYGASATRRSPVDLVPQSLSERADPPPRTSTGHPEFDRALGGGLVEGGVTLLGGDPGIGKSTLLMQVAAHLSRDRKCVYFSGEESANQIQLRARRLHVERSPVQLIPSSDALAIADYIEQMPAGSVAIVDSIQAMNAGGDSAPGSVSQVKTSAAHLIPAAKTADVALVLVSHVTQEGTLAGPNLLKHAVDTTIYLETDRAGGLYRLVRAEKNRFGPAGEIGVFEMTERGMIDIENPSEVFISQRDKGAFGTIIYPSIEGTRPLLLEVQALVTPTAFGTGRRSSTGWDIGRMNMILATMQARLGISFADCDIYVNVAGGIKITDPAMDLAAALAIISAKIQQPMPPSMTAFGEIGLAGEVRNTSRSASRIKEAVQMGIDHVVCPRLSESVKTPGSVTFSKIARLAEVLSIIPDAENMVAA